MNNPPVIVEAVGNRACYYPGKDSVQMSFFQDFDVAEEFYSVLFHELGHYADIGIMVPAQDTKADLPEMRYRRAVGLGLKIIAKKNSLQR